MTPWQLLFTLDLSLKTMLKARIHRQKYSVSRKVKLELRHGGFIFDNEIISKDGIKRHKLVRFTPPPCSPRSRQQKVLQRSVK